MMENEDVYRRMKCDTSQSVGHMVPCTASLSTWPGPVFSSRVENACRMSALPPFPIDVWVYFDVIQPEAVVDSKW